jgi:hypothetical protein
MGHHVVVSLTRPRGWRRWKSEPSPALVKRDWVATGRIDFATHVEGNAAPEADRPSEFKLIVEERRVVESVTGLENLEIQWRLATLKEAKAVISQYHRFLSENSLIKTVVEDTGFVFTPPKRIQMVSENSAAGARD